LAWFPPAEEPSGAAEVLGHNPDAFKWICLTLSTPVLAQLALLGVVDGCADDSPMKRLTLSLHEGVTDGDRWLSTPGASSLPEVESEPLPAAR
jgi:hypothetical protein